MDTFTIRFFLRESKRQSSKGTVYVRIIYLRKKVDLSTGIKCREDEWDSNREKFKRNTYQNQQLLKLEEKIYQAKHNLDESGKHYTSLDIKKVIQGTKSTGPILLKFFQDHLSRRESDISNTKATFLKYRQTYGNLEDCLRKINLPDLPLSKVNLSIVTEFDEYLKQIEWNNLGDKLTLTTRNKHHSRLKAVLNDAIRREYLDQNPYINWKLSFPNSKREYLTTKELGTIAKFDFSGNKSLEKVRDIFVFSCYTGLRYQDAMNLKMNSIHNIDAQYYLRIDQQKTGERREIPLFEAAQKIIVKYTHSNERRVMDKVLPQYSNQKINMYLKIIGQIVGITKNLTHHVARHTCATTVLLDNGVPLEMVSHWLGHNSVRTTQQYAKISHNNLTKETKRLERIFNQT